jgi:integrase
MPITLTARNIATLPPPADGSGNRQIDYWDAVEEGLALRVSPTHRGWIVRYRVDGRRRRLALGSTRDFSLADARQKAHETKRLAADGIDPAVKRQERREAGTFGELALEYINRHAKPTKRTWKDDQRTIDTELLAKTGADWKHVIVRDITRPMIRRVFDAITDRGAPVMANRTLALVSKMLNVALSLDWIEANPAALIRKNRERARERVLTDSEIRELWSALCETERTDDHARPVARLNATLNDAFKMRFYTSQRGGEVFRMRWADLDLETAWWEIPREHTKNGELHRVPLVPAAVELLRERRSIARKEAQYVFEHRRRSRNPEQQFGNVAARGNKAAAFLSRGDAHFKSKRARSLKRPRLLPGLSFEFRGHDIRRTASTNMTKAGVARDDVSKVLNHVDRGARATKVYDRYEYDKEKRAALQRWADRLADILQSQPAPQTGTPSERSGARPSLAIAVLEPPSDEQMHLGHA